MGSPEVSVVIAVLNGAAFVPRIFSRLESQRFSDFEAIFVVSSKSTDSTLEAAEECCSRDPRFRAVVYQDTGALGGSKNRGIEEAKGSSLWFLDVDDFPSERFLEVMAPLRRREGVDVAACNFRYCTEERPFEEPEGEPEVAEMPAAEALMARACDRFPVTSWSMLYSRDLVEREGLRFPEGLHEDISFTYRALAAADRVCYCSTPLYGYSITPGSVTRDPANRDANAMTEIARYEEIEDLMSERGADPELLSRLALTRARSAGHMSRDGFAEYMGSERFLGRLPDGNALVRFEVWCMRRMPRLYHRAMQTYFRAFRYRPGRSFTRRLVHALL